MTSSEQEWYNEIWMEVRDYANESCTRFVTGDIDVESDWDDYVQTLERMGIEEMLEIQQTIFTRHYR